MSRQPVVTRRVMAALAEGPMSHAECRKAVPEVSPGGLHVLLYRNRKAGHLVCVGTNPRRYALAPGLPKPIAAPPVWDPPQEWPHWFTNRDAGNEWRPAVSEADELRVA